MNRTPLRLTGARYPLPATPLYKAAGASPVDSLEKDEAGNPDYSYYSRNKKEYDSNSHRILRHGRGGQKWALDPDGKIAYDSEPSDQKSLKPPQITDPQGKPVKPGPDPHGFIATIMEAAKRGRVALPMHVAVEMGNAAHEAAERTGADHRSHIERGTKGEGKDRAKNQQFVAPFIAMLTVGEQHLKPDDLRMLMARVAADFRDGQTDVLPDGTQSPVPIPLGAVARMHQTQAERRDGKGPRDHMTPEDGAFHESLGKYNGQAKRAAAGRQKDPNAVMTHLADLKAKGKHHVKELAETRKRTRDEDAKKPKKEHEEHARAHADQVEAGHDAQLAPMSDDDLQKLMALLEQVQADPDSAVEVQGIPEGTRSGKQHFLGGLSQSVEQEGAKVDGERLPMEAIFARALLRSLQHRTSGHINRATKDVPGPGFHLLAHRDILADRHGMARHLVEGHHADPEHSMTHQLGLDPFRVARHLVQSLPPAEEFLKLIGDAGMVPEKVLHPPKDDKNKKKEAKPGVGAGPSPGKPAVMVVKGYRSTGVARPGIPTRMRWEE